MTEFTQGMSNTFKGLMKTSLGLAILYTLGHICIAMIVVVLSRELVFGNLV